MRHPSARTRSRTIAAAVSAVIVILGVTTAILYAQKPSAPTDPSVIQITGTCCLADGPPGVEVGTPLETPNGALLRIFPLRAESGVRDGAVSLTYDLAVWTEDATYTETQTRLTDTNLRVGDTVTHGPATIEVVAIHDAFLDRNDAVDLRVTFDLDRIDEAP